MSRRREWAGDGGGLQQVLPVSSGQEWAAGLEP